MAGPDRARRRREARGRGSSPDAGPAPRPEAADARPDDRAQARQASLVILVAVGLWLALASLGGELGLPARYALLVDMLVMAALGWAIWVLVGVWRRRSAGKDG